MTLLQHEHAGPLGEVIIIPRAKHSGGELQNNLPEVTLCVITLHNTPIYSLDGLRGEDGGVCPPFEDVVQEPALAPDTGQCEAGDQERGDTGPHEEGGSDGSWSQVQCHPDTNTGVTCHGIIALSWSLHTRTEP